MCDDGNGKKSYQIWINNKDAGFSLGQEGQLPSGVQSVSFADMGEQNCSFLAGAV
jgi:integrin alpha FG-GAP repeat containing protein 1